MSLAVKQIAVTYLAVVLALSLIAFVFYGFDKRRARKDGRGARPALRGLGAPRWADGR